MRDAQDTKGSAVGGPAMFHGAPREAYKIDENDTVTRFVPKMIKLTLPDHTQRVFRPGLQQIPRELADHQWLIDNGVIEYGASDKLPPMMQPALPGTQAYAASVGQSGVYDATMIPNYAVSDAQVSAADAVAKMAADHAARLRVDLEEAERVATQAAVAAADARTRAAATRSPEEGSRGQDDIVTSKSDTSKTNTDGDDAADEVRAARYEKLTDKMKEDYDELETDEERDAFLDSKGR